MNAKELIEYLQKFKNPEQLQVIIKAKTTGPKLGSMDYAKIKQVYRGIDWNINLVIVAPEEDLFTEKGYEEWKMSARKKSRELRKK